jgi:Gluconate 2-dehydrogenase subunit 3
MNRRKALGRILLAGIGGTLALGGYKWYDWNKSPDLAWLDRKKELLAALADTIIPPTEVPAAHNPSSAASPSTPSPVAARHIPGAGESGAAAFMLVLLKDCTDRRTLNKFIEGLKDLEAHCRSSYQSSFIQCPEATRQEVLARFEEKDKPLQGIWGKAEGRYLGKPFFITLKEYTVQAYCSSEMGATRGLDYVPVPGSYHGCIPLQPDTRAWATK